MRIIVVLLFFCACHPPSKTQSQNSQLLQKIVDEEIGRSAIVTLNDSKTFALAALRKEDLVYYGVIRVADHALVLKNTVRGTIAWSGDMKLSESRIPGIVKKDSRPDDYTRTIDLSRFLVQNQ